MSKNHALEIRSGERFDFGENWARFLAEIDETRIAEAERSLVEMLGPSGLTGRSFLDVGSGSGLSSLAARRLGATVTSIDYDPQSVECTRVLRQRYFAGDPHWRVEEGSILDDADLHDLGKFDVVYCWGVAHHTGQMWRAIDNLLKLVSPNGWLWVALYNTGAYAKRWRYIKRAYCALPDVLRLPFALSVIAPIQGQKLVSAAIRGKAGQFVGEIRNYRRHRGMSWWRDQVDWIGGYPYETATPDEVFNHITKAGFRLHRLVTVGGGTGCNQYVFVREAMARGRKADAL